MRRVVIGAGVGLGETHTARWRRVAALQDESACDEPVSANGTAGWASPPYQRRRAGRTDRALPPRHNREPYPLAKRCFLPNKPTFVRAQLRVDVSVMLRLMNLEKANFRWVCFDYLPPFRVDYGANNAHWTRFMGEAKPTYRPVLPHYVDRHARQGVTSDRQPRRSRLAHGICVAEGAVSGV
jgi:hypothetical protein